MLPEYGPTGPELMRRRFGPRARRVLAAVVAVVVLALALLIATRSGDGLTTLEHRSAPAFTLLHPAGQVRRVQPATGELVRLRSRRGPLEITVTVRRLTLPAYSGSVSGFLPVYADRHARALAAEVPGFIPRSDGKARVNDAPGYQLRYRTGTENRPTTGDRHLRRAGGRPPRRGHPALPPDQSAAAAHRTRARPRQGDAQGVPLLPLRPRSPRSRTRAAFRGRVPTLSNTRGAMRKLQSQGVHHITIIGADRQTSIDFWEGLLGMPFVFEQPNLDNASESHLYFDPGDGRLITVFTNEDRTPDPARTPTDPGCVHHLAFALSQATFARRSSASTSARSATAASRTAASWTRSTSRIRSGS